MALISLEQKIEEGMILCKWFKNRMILRNQNVLLVTTGGTGSGKSYCDLKIAEIWYMFQFKKPFPVENICFGIKQLIQRLNSGDLKKGDLLILEESGVNMGSLDFNTRISKLFGYVLQSFRSLNIGILFNLPHLSMLNKSARMLIHSHIQTYGIDRENNILEVKPFFCQINQQTGKIYQKYPRIIYKGEIVTVHKFLFSLPSKELRDAYEKLKFKFITDFAKDFEAELDELDNKKEKKLSRTNLSPIQMEIYDMVIDGLTTKEIARKRDTSVRSVYEVLQTIKKKGYEVKISKNY